MPEPMSGCWLWIGGVNEHGYGVFWNGERLEKAHRFSFRAHKGFIEDDEDCRHSCDNPPCVNPDHLHAGSTLANVHDMWHRSRATVQIRRGTAQVQAKLTDEKAAAIREAYATGAVTQYELAEQHGVHQRTIFNVIHQLNWTAPSGLTLETGRGF